MSTTSLFTVLYTLGMSKETAYDLSYVKYGSLQDGFSPIMKLNAYKIKEIPKYFNKTIQ